MGFAGASLCLCCIGIEVSLGWLISFCVLFLCVWPPLPFWPSIVFGGVLGCGFSMFIWFSPFVRVVFAPSQLYFLCHFNATSVLVMFCRYFLWFFFLTCFLFHLGWVGNGHLLLFNAFCLILLLVLFDKSLCDVLAGHICLISSPGHFYFLYYWPWFLCVLWPVESVWWCSVVRGYKGLPLRPMASPWFLRFDLSLAFVVFCWYTTMVVGLLSQFCIRVWNLVFQSACFCRCPSGSDSAWFLKGDYCSKEPLLLLRLHLFGISVASSLELWQPHPSVVLLWTHDVWTLFHGSLRSTFLFLLQVCLLFGSQVFFSIASLLLILWCPFGVCLW